MKLSLDLSSASELPSSEEVEQLFRHAEEMGLDKNFDHVHVYYSNEKAWVVFEGSYKSVFTDDDPSNVCILIVVLETQGGNLQGRFRIWDPTRDANIILTEGLLPYHQFIELIKRAQDIGALHRDIRGTWDKVGAWKDSLQDVRHG